MPKIIVLKAFAFAHRGVEVQQFEPHAEPQEAAQEVVDHAGLVEEGYIQLADDEPSAPPAPAPQQPNDPDAAPAPAPPPAPAPAPARKTSAKKAGQ